VGVCGLCGCVYVGVCVSVVCGMFVWV